MRIRRLPVLVLLLAAALLISACGGDDERSGADGTGTPSPPAGVDPELDDFDVVADRFCHESMARQEEVRRRAGDQQNLADRARLLGELAPIRAELAEQLAGVGFPEEAGEARSELVDAARRRAEASAEAEQRWQRGEPPRRIAAAVARENAERAIFVEVARELDFEDCAERLSPPQEREAALTTIRALMGPPARRCAIYSARLLEQEFGDLGRCRRARPVVPRPGDVEVRSADGVNNVFALVRVDTDTGAFRIRLTWENGGYRVDRLD